jgi:nucleoside phosphorylase
MSGICGGFSSRANLGQLFVCSMVYEYQSGKWSGDGFKQEPYQCTTDHVTLTKLRALVSQVGLIGELESGFTGTRPGNARQPEVGIFTSGSAVIADKSHLNLIEKIHRKVNALDMEVFALHKASEISCVRPACISAKTVVDLCDSEKADNLHQYGSFISAKFLVKAISNHFGN